MPLIKSSQAYDQYLKNARNSSHAVWFCADLQFFESIQDHWVIGFQVVGDVTLIALEPLIPGTPLEYNQEHKEAFKRTWTEFSEQVCPKIICFVGVYAPFKNFLENFGFMAMQIGHEPWMDLNDCLPSGNSAKGVRAARNQAIHAGMTIEEWDGTLLKQNAIQRQTLTSLYQQWINKRFMKVTGFLNSIDLFLHSENRKYFIAKSKFGNVEGYLIATPIPGIKSSFLEDMILAPNCTRGAGELLTLEALKRLGDAGFKRASLGVVSLTNVTEFTGPELPKLVKFISVQLPLFIQKLYNLNGLECFRKRFKPKSWENIFLVVKDQSPKKNGDSMAWLKTLLALAYSFKPRLNLSPYWFKSTLISWVRFRPLSMAVTAVMLTLFASINHFDNLPYWALKDFGFTANVSSIEWVYRTVTSDFLYFNPLHFWLWGGFLVILLRWAETTHKFSFICPLYLGVIFFDDIINYCLIIAPFHFLKPSLYTKLILTKDVGGSLGMMFLLGLQICQLKKNREIVFSVIILGVVFGFVFQSLQFQLLILNLNHFLFLTIGFIVGKLRFQSLKNKNELASRRKPVVAQHINSQNKAA